MTLYEKLCKIYPELASIDPSSMFWQFTIVMQDNSDGNGPFIAEWHYEKAQPTQEQLDAITE